MAEDIDAIPVIEDKIQKKCKKIEDNFQQLLDSARQYFINAAGLEKTNIDKLKEEQKGGSPVRRRAAKE